MTSYNSEHEQDSFSYLVSFSISFFFTSVVGGERTEGVSSYYPLIINERLGQQTQSNKLFPKNMLSFNFKYLLLDVQSIID
jgi:hypothetical protein